MKNRTPIRIELQPVDLVWETLSAVTLLFLLIYPVIWYSALPETIPIHFNHLGEPDGFGSRQSVWGLPLVGLLLYVLLTVLSRSPHLFNYPVKITEENAEYHYRIGARLVRMLKGVILVLFSWIVWQVVEGASSGTAQLNPAFLWVLFGGIGGTLGWYFFSTYRRRT